MRHAIAIAPNIWMAMDNSGSIGELALDDVHVPNAVASYYSARVALFELWSARAQATHILLANFTGEAAWTNYVTGIDQLFQEIGVPPPPITGSTESNFQMKQSAFSISMVGTKKWEPVQVHERMQYYVIGRALVGEQLIKHQTQAVHVKELYDALESGVVAAIWPTGSKGIHAEIARLQLPQMMYFEDGDTSAGPSTAVIVASSDDNIAQHFTAPCRKIT